MATKAPSPARAPFKCACGPTMTVIPGSVIAYSAFVWLLEHEPVSLVSTYAYVNPLVAVLAGWALLSEEITPRIAIGATAILMSVAFVIRSERRPVAAAQSSS